MPKRSLAVAAALALALAACAKPRPVIYPTNFYKSRTPAQVQQDVDDCEKEAEAFLKTDKGKAILKRTARGGVFGAFIGLIWGAFTGNYGRAIAEGAAIGAAAGLAHGVTDASGPGAIERAYTDRCLEEKGYQPLGWK